MRAAHLWNQLISGAMTEESAAMLVMALRQLTGRIGPEQAAKLLGFTDAKIIGYRLDHDGYQSKVVRPTKPYVHTVHDLLQPREAIR
jgi:hypothetical protein